MFSHEELKTINTKFEGIYSAVVEDNNDPNKAGRVRIRIMGLHTSKKEKNDSEGIPVDELPWAIPGNPIFGGSVSGLGMSGVPVQGSIVAIFFLAGNHNHPIYFASIPGFPATQPDTSKGFSDPDGIYPEYLDEPDWNREARADGTETLKDLKDANLETFEPNSPSAPEYPHNIVLETPGDGIIVEYDSTPNAERYHIFHKASKAYIEIGPNGDMVMKSTGDKYEISAKGRKVFIKENDIQQIDGGLDITVNELINFNSGDEAMMLGYKTADWLESHTHPTGTGTSGVPIQSGSVDSLLSKKIFGD